MLTLKAKLLLFYLFNFGFLVVLSVLFSFKWFLAGCLCLILFPFCQGILRPLPVDYRKIFRPKLVKVCLIIFSINAIVIAVTNVVFFYTNPFFKSLEKINALGFIVSFVFLIPVAVAAIREDIKTAISIDKDTKNHAEVG